MSNSNKKFEKAVLLVKQLPSDGDDKPSEKEQLEFYALFKQATEGNVSIPRPGMMDFTKKYKWDAWKTKENMSQDEAKTKYVQLLVNKMKSASNQEQAQKILDQLEAVDEQ